MRKVLLFILALVAVWIVGHIVVGFVLHIAGAILTIGMILLFCYLVYSAYKLMTRQKI